MTAARSMAKSTNLIGKGYRKWSMAHGGPMAVVSFESMRVMMGEAKMNVPLHPRSGDVSNRELDVTHPTSTPRSLNMYTRERLWVDCSVFLGLLLGYHIIQIIN